MIVNHLRSLSGIDGADGERIRAKRRAQAEFLAALIQARQATERVISVGDYNAFPFNDGLVDVVGTVKGQPTPPDQVALASADLVDPDLTNLGDAPRRRAAVLVRVRRQRAGARPHPREQPGARSASPARRTRAATPTSRSRCAATRRGRSGSPITTRRSPTSRSRRRRSSPGRPPLDVEAYTSFTIRALRARRLGPLRSRLGRVDVNAGRLHADLQRDQRLLTAT